MTDPLNEPMRRSGALNRPDNDGDARRVWLEDLFRADPGEQEDTDWPAIVRKALGRTDEPITNQHDNHQEN